MTLSGLVEARAQAQPQAMALLSPGGTALTYADLWQQTQALADALRAVGATAGMPVATVLPNGTDAAITFLATASRTTCVPLNPRLAADEVRFFLQDTGARFIIVDKSLDTAASEIAQELGLTVLEIDGAAQHPGETRDWLAGVKPARLRPAPPLQADTALILHTSGTTSKPKLVPLLHRNLIASALNIARCLQLQPTDRCLNVMPLFHIHGLVGVLLASLAAGSSVVCTPGFNESRFIDWLAEFQPTWYSAVPTIHQRVASLSAPYRDRAAAHRFRFIRSSSAALPPATMRKLEEGMGAPVIEAYGMTEASHQMASNPLPPGLRKPGSVGVSAGAELAVMDEKGNLLEADELGEIVIRGPGVIAGYGGDPSQNAAAFSGGWFRTGDLGRIDGDGYLFLAGRLKEIVNRGGEKVSPREIDEALLEHADVGQAAAFGVPHPTLGEDLVAAVVPSPGSTPEVAALRQFLFGRLAAHKVPSNLIFVPEIPKGPTGKVQRNTLYSRLGHLLVQTGGAASSELEHALEAIFRAILGIGPTGVHANFFALGGDSLTGVRVVTAINRAYGIQLGATVLFHHPTIAELVPVIEQAKAAEHNELADLRDEIDAMTDEEVERALAEDDSVPPADPLGKDNVNR
jgi:oxalate---CoA ligase